MAHHICWIYDVGWALRVFTCLFAPREPMAAFTEINLCDTSDWSETNCAIFRIQLLWKSFWRSHQTPLWSTAHCRNSTTSSMSSQPCVITGLAVFHLQCGGGSCWYNTQLRQRFTLKTIKRSTLKFCMCKYANCVQRTIIKLCNQQVTDDRINRVKNLTLESEREGSFVFDYRGELNASLNGFSELTHENMLALNILKRNCTNHVIEGRDFQAYRE